MITESVEKIHNWLEIGGYKRGDVSKTRLAISLIEEELQELKDAINNEDEKETNDAISDLWFVIHNVSFFQGFLPDNINTYFEGVIQSNYSKYCDNEEDAIKSVELYRSGEHPSKLGSNSSNLSIICFSVTIFYKMLRF